MVDKGGKQVRFKKWWMQSKKSIRYFIRTKDVEHLKDVLRLAKFYSKKQPAIKSSGLTKKYILIIPQKGFEIMGKKMIEILISDYELHKQELERELINWKTSDGIQEKVVLKEKLIYMDTIIQNLKDVWEVM